MTTYNTGNPVGSTDARDLSDNAQNFDRAMNDSSPSWVDRTGATRPTWAGIATYAGPAYDVSNYDSLADAIAAFPATPATIQYGEDQTLTANLVVPANVELMPLNGAVINHGAYTISYAGSTARWPLAQVFNGTGLVTLAGKSLPEWWGAKGDGVTNDTAPLTRAVNSSGIVKLLNRSYLITSITLPAGTTVIGDKATVIVGYDGSGFKTGYGRSLGISASVASAHTDTSTTFADTLTTVTVSDTTGYNVGDLVALVGAGATPQTFVAHITALTSTTITLDDYLIYTVTTPTLYKLTPQNITISGLTMYHGIDTPSAGSYLIEINGPFVKVENCEFGHTTFVKSRAISAVSSFGKIVRNRFNNVDLAVQIYNGNINEVSDNLITNFRTAIRAIYCDRTKIIKNRIHNGTDMSYGIGIDVVASGAYDKNCRNLIAFNSVIRANKGVLGSGIGGIHLNFAANQNRVISNESKHNSIGIYLENAASDNTISGNDASDNDGYYGVGIQLDWNCNRNTISGNVTNNNRGSMQAKESSGIEVRSFTANPCLHNTLIGNTAKGNGLEGFRIGGLYTTAIGNVAEGNGVDVAAFNAYDASLLGWDFRVVGEHANLVGNISKQNFNDARDASLYSLVSFGIHGAKFVSLTGNRAYAGAKAKYALRVTGSSSDIAVHRNDFVAVTTNGSAVSADGNVRFYLEANTIYQNSNTEPPVEIINTAAYSFWDNKLIGPSATSNDLTGSTNRYTPADN